MGSMPFPHNGTSSSWETILTSAQSHMASLVLLTPAISCFLWFFASWQTSPLKNFPGPLLAGWTNVWRLWQVITADYAPRMKKLHEKHGPVVRLGPNLLDIDYPELVKVIYGTDGRWKKSDLYKNSSTIIDGKITYHMFSETDNKEHAKLKRPVVRHFSVPSVLAMEPHMDKTIDEFCDHLERRFVDTVKVCEFGDWLAYFAWDFLGFVTFSRKFGYMDEGCDFDGTLAIGDQAIDYLGLCGQMPWLDHWLDKNPVYPLGPPNLSNVTRIAIENLTARLKGEDETFNHQKPDFLQYFINSKGTHPDIVNEGTIVGYLLLNLIAGADTTAITMRALFYYCLKNPRIWKRLEAEVVSNIPADKPVPYAIARGLPYLEAVCRETLRYHPSVAMTMERIVPESGVTLPDGSFVKGGTLIGMNPYIIGRNKTVYGDDADDFRPERWLQQQGEDDEAYKLRMRQWNAADIGFGGGSRICLGRNLSLMEIYKVVPSLISRFEIELVDPNEKWWTSSRWFYRTKGVICNLKRRAPKA
ncbi:benzoate 4-monooxygenase cytochrome P450 [Colletotrichum orchidophilum]|uniref:Benzoate 4-monooxygenase cytochrome P450 n=1 Tax=Colletotrichum orchidophilum TaxID=1209926 RepID=A0A1G4BT80_9PEZI|nr:benzoate 4-monooxygenase cytochrome P450 [Colletotrichum orchidophilum]OHF04526.1 benzoate 4-monooxygenase cytochrome P450 [Colletotrichum orchidophilum]